MIQKKDNNLIENENHFEKNINKLKKIKKCIGLFLKLYNLTK